MQEFPFTDAEWDPIGDLAGAIPHARYTDGDEALADSLRVHMLDLLAALRARHGDHPVLLETIADYTEDAAEQVSLYRRALELAEVHGLRTLSIRLALAGVLVHELGDSAAALGVLDECGADAPGGSKDERSQWASLLTDAAIEAEPAERVALFRRAAEIATAHGQSAFYIRLLLVRFWLDEGQTDAARAELSACAEAMPGAAEDDRAFWAQLCEEVDFRPETPT